MEFEFRIPEDARLRAHISQRNNLKYVKIVMNHFDEQQRQDFRNSPLGYLVEVLDIQFSAQQIQQLVFRTVRTDKVNELWFNVQGHLMRFDLQEYALVTGLRCGVFPEGDDFDRLLQRTRRLLHGFRGSWARKFQKAKRRQEKKITYTIHDFPIFMQLHVYATLRPTDAEAEQPYFSTLVSYDDPPVPVLDDIARTIVASQFNASYANSRNGRQSARKGSDDGVARGGSGNDEMSGDDDGDGQLGSDRDSDDIEDTVEGVDDRSSDGEDTRRGQIGTSSTPREPQVTSPVQGPTMETRAVGTSGQA
ncbi:Hypothetical predicted protein [Olea europaea subsp. europaea]|uniref:DUF1985 domain-containing protein n=1 Tax=Olea europaea subsp. europaea TaxID=158383 RepID=A0A8S0T187_OLEEU|nr:Hypothetical predicted protein [Olea europaea subsp. europaea]